MRNRLLVATLLVTAGESAAGGGGPRRVIEDLTDGGRAGGPDGAALLDVALDAQHMALERTFEAVDVVGREVRRLVEGERAVVAFGGDAVENDDMEAEVGIEARAEAVQEGDGAELRSVRGAGTDAPERGADGAQQDAEHIAGQTFRQSFATRFLEDGYDIRPVQELLGHNARWIDGPEDELCRLRDANGSLRVFDTRNRPLLLFRDEFALRRATRGANDSTPHEVAV